MAITRGSAVGALVSSTLALAAMSPGSAHAAPFGAPQALHPDASTDGAADHDFRPAIATDGDVWVVVYTTSHAPGSAAGDWDLLVTRSTDAGATWSAPAILNSDATSDTRDDFQARIAYDGSGVWLTVWRAGLVTEESDILWSRSTDGGVTWSSAAPLNTNAGTDTGDDSKPSVAGDGSGTWIATWYSEEDIAGAGTDIDIFFARSTDGGVIWSAPSVLNSNATDPVGGWDRNPMIVTDGAGTWVTAWSSREDVGGAIGTDDDVLFAVSTDDGITWSASAPLHATAATDGNSEDLLWDLRSDDATLLAVSSAPLGGSGARDLWVTRSIDSGATWETPVTINADPVDPTDGGDSSGALARLGSIWVVVWTSFDVVVPPPPANPFGTDEEIHFAVSQDDGVSWGPDTYIDPSVVADTAGGDDGFPAVAGSGARLVAVWESGESYGSLGSDQDVLVALGGIGTVPVLPVPWMWAVAALVVAATAAMGLGRWDERASASNARVRPQPQRRG